MLKSFVLFILLKNRLYKPKYISKFEPLENFKDNEYQDIMYHVLQK